MNQELARRLTVITRLVESSPAGNLGRTALMKLVYFLSVLRDVNLGYRFTLYSYGPFDAAVLEDADYASRIDALNVQMDVYPRGYGYSITPGPAAAKTKALAADYLEQHEGDLVWVLERFGALTASELELTSTIVYVDRENRSGKARVNEQDLARKVRQIKPHFAIDHVSSRVTNLRNQGLLTAVE